MSETAQKGAIRWVKVYKGTKDADEWHAAQAILRKVLDAKGIDEKPVLSEEEQGALRSIVGLVPREGQILGFTADKEYEGVEVGIRYEGPLESRKLNQAFTRVILENAKRWAAERKGYSRQEFPEAYYGQDHPDTSDDTWAWCDEVFQTFVAGIKGRPGVPELVDKSDQEGMRKVIAFLSSMGPNPCAALAKEILGTQSVPPGDRFPAEDPGNV